MRKDGQVVVVMPFHKSEMNHYELISFKNNVKVLKNHSIFLLLPKGTNPKGFIAVAPNIQIMFFDQKYFDTYEGSNLLWLTAQLYDTFSHYDYLLKCELDAFVFRDELNYWCRFNYDFIGAPWMLDWVNSFMKKQFTNFKNSSFAPLGFIKKQLAERISKQEYHVGNGGLSLRKVSTFRWISKFLPYIYPNVYRTGYQEDLVWNTYVASLYPFYRLPDYKMASRFSIESEMKTCIQYNGDKLPFGCHAWYKYDLDFWRPYIEERGFTIHDTASQN